MYEFNYQRPGDVASAVAARQGNADALFLAGGMTLLPTLKLRLQSSSIWRRFRIWSAPTRRVT